MTDKQIIKALEYCSKDTVLCTECPLKDVGYTCEDNLVGYALNLINRQRQKNDRHIKKAKSEAIKEFAERLKNLLHYDVALPSGIIDERIVYEAIDDIEKEMTEGKNNA